MRFSDLKKIKPEPPREERPAAPPQAAPAALAAPAAPPAAAEPPARPPAEIPAPVRPEALSPKNRARQEPPRPSAAANFREQQARGREVYARLLTQTGDFLKAADRPYCEKYEAVTAVCGVVAETLKDNNTLLGFTTYSTGDDYLRGHSANTAVLALAMGVQAGLDPAQLRLLGFCAVAHDVGMTAYSALYNSGRRLTDAEEAEMELHAGAGADKLDRVVDLDYKVKERARKIVRQTHERADGSGYPDRVSGDEIDPLAQLIAIADAYEAMTHPRAWRGPLAPPDAVKELIEREGRGFNAGAVKLLVSVISVFPAGSLVRLSTGETARVLASNRGSLTRPLVEKLLDGDYEEVPPAMLDLMEHPLVSIERPAGAAEIAAHNPGYAGKLELAQWWTDW